MSSTHSPANARSHASDDSKAQWEPESPFVDRLVLAEAPYSRRASSLALAAPSPYATESPFLSVYETGLDDAYASPQATELYGILAELRDAEFDAAVYQLQAEAYDLLAPRLEGEDDLSEYEVDQFFEAHFGPLVRETGRLLDGIATEMERHDLDTMTEPEIDHLLEPFEPRSSGLTPSFEGFLKKVWKKAKTAVKKVASAAKKGVVKAVKTVGKIATAPVAIILKKLKSLVKPLLQKVLKSAIGRLPEPLQDAARQAARKLFGDKAKTSDTPEESELAAFEAGIDTLNADGIESTDDEVGYLQTEFDLQLANLVLAADETRQDIAIADYEGRARRLGVGPHIRLRRARRRFVHELQALGDGDDVTPAVERFIPAVLPVLKLGLKVIGRKRVVEAIGKLVANLLRPFVGPKMSRPLANAIVGTGMKLVGLEIKEEDKAAAAAEATASVVEDTIRRVAQLPAEVLEDEIFLEAAVEEAFDTALSRNFPPMPRRPELVSSELPGRWSRPGEYERFEPDSPISITISPVMARDLKTFGGATPTVLTHSLTSLVGQKATVWIYRAVSGTWLSKISRDEKADGLGGIEEYRWRSIHPLTRAAAAILLNDASMGTDVDSKFLQSPQTINVGQRFFYLEIPGLIPGKVIGHDSAFFYVLDCPRRFGSVTFYLSEQEAQEIARHLRSGNRAKAGVELGKVWMRIAVRAFKEGLGDAVDIRKEAIQIENALPAVLLRFGPMILKGLRWLVVALGPKIAKMLFDAVVATRFIELADDPEDGITFKLTWRNTAGFDVVCRMLNSQTVPLEEFGKELRKLLENHVNNLPAPELTAGYHRD